MIKSIVFEYHFQPREIAEMYVDDFDFQGIVYWYKEFQRLEELRKPKK